MAISSRVGVLLPSDVEEALRRAEEALRPDVVHIRYDFGEDWTGAPAIYFRVLLTDESAANVEDLGKLAFRVIYRIEEEVKPDLYDLRFHVNFRSQSEQAELAEPAWA